MDTISYSSLRRHLANTLDKVNTNHVSILITRQKGKSAVIMSLDDFKSYEATAHLMSNLNNATRLNQSIAEIEAGKSVSHGLIEE